MNFEDVYSYLMDESIYESWQEMIEDQLESSKETRILDLACGTGRLSMRLAQAGFQLTGYDLSEDMLARADQLQVQEQVVFPLIQGDMRDLSQLPSYQAIVCSLDALCYLESEEDLVKVFDQVFSHLETSGFFFFDVHSTFQMKEIYPDYSYHYAEEDFAFLWDSFEGEHTYSVVHELDLFVKEGSVYRRKERIIREQTYPLDFYLSSLKKLGFEPVNVYTDYPSQELDSQARRWFFICQKGGSTR